MVTNVGKSEAGDLHVDITIRNETADWSAMQAVQDKRSSRPAAARPQTAIRFLSARVVTAWRRVFRCEGTLQGQKPNRKPS